MTEFKDIIPMGNENDTNSGDSWFVLSSASEEDSDSEEEDPKLEEKKNCQKEAAGEKPKNEELGASVEEGKISKEDEYQSVKPKTEELGVSVEKGKISQKDEKECQNREPKSEEPSVPMEEEKNLKEVEQKKIKPKSEEPSVPMEEEKNLKEVEQKKLELSEENLVPIKKEETPKKAEQKEPESKSEESLAPAEEKKNVKKAEEKKAESKSEKPLAPMEEKKNVKKSEHKKAESKSEKPLAPMEEKKNAKKSEHKKAEPKSEEPSRSNKERKILKEVEHRRSGVDKHKQKSKRLLSDEEGHSEIALEVHALRETLIQLSLNLSNTEEEKFTAITSEVQALKETLTQFNNDLASRVSQIETRTEQVHTLLCRFIMTRYGNYNKEQTAHTINTRKENHPSTSHIAVQTEILDCKQTSMSALSESSTVPSDQKVSLHTNQNTEKSPIVDTTSHIARMDDSQNNQASKERSLVGKTLDSSAKEPAHSNGAKRIKLADETIPASKESSGNGETSEESSSFPSTPNREEPSKFSKEKPHHNQLRPKPSKQPMEQYHNQRDTFNQYPPSYQNTKYGGTNRELAELAYRYSTENDRYHRKGRSNRMWQQSTTYRKHPYSKQAHDGQNVYSEDTQTGKPRDELPGELVDYMDKVIDEWAQDEDD